MDCGLISSKHKGFSAKLPRSTGATGSAGHVALRDWLVHSPRLWTGAVAAGPPVHGGPGPGSGERAVSGGPGRGGAMAGLTASSLRVAVVHGRPCRGHERVARGAVGVGRGSAAARDGRGALATRRRETAVVAYSGEAVHRKGKEKTR